VEEVIAMKKTVVRNDPIGGSRDQSRSVRVGVTVTVSV
jgi:hypothetical protein